MTEGQMNLEVDCETRKVTRTREVRLSIAEAAESGIEVGRLAGEIEKAKKAAKEAESKQDDLISVLKKNSTTKDVECIMKLFYSTRTVQVFDGEEMLEERAMTDQEFQMELGEVKHGVVMDAEEEPETELTEEQAKQDLQDVIREEQSATKPSLVDLNSH